MPARPTYAFDNEGHTVVTKGQCKYTSVGKCKRRDTPPNTLDWVFGLFKGLAFGEALAIGMTLLAQVYVMMPNSTVGIFTQFPYWAIRMFGGETMVFTWIVIGMLITWVFDVTCPESSK